MKRYRNSSSWTRLHSSMTVSGSWWFYLTIEDLRNHNDEVLACTATIVINCSRNKIPIILPCTLWWTNITMENHHFEWENPLFLWPCSIAFCMFTRGYPQRIAAGGSPALPRSCPGQRSASTWCASEAAYTACPRKGEWWRNVNPGEMTWHQWEFQDPKMEVLYHIRPYFVGSFPYICLKNRPYIWNRYLQSIGSWNGHWHDNKGYPWLVLLVTYRLVVSKNVRWSPAEYVLSHGSRLKLLWRSANKELPSDHVKAAAVGKDWHLRPWARKKTGFRNVYYQK